jgi:hypothetical protein
MTQGGILIHGKDKGALADNTNKFISHLTHLGLNHLINTVTEGNIYDAQFKFADNLPNLGHTSYDTLKISDMYGFHPHVSVIDTEKEILIALLSGPVTFEYPNYAEFLASIQIRCNIVVAARQTTLAFHTSKIERPKDYWHYSEESGFTVLPGKSLIKALQKATQPEKSAGKFSFSCYRATEYVILLGIAQELALVNPKLLQKLQLQWEVSAIKSRLFHEVFLYEYGSMQSPIPNKYYVPGDRLWFRNPDVNSAEVEGYEGSWVFYIGEGLFTNFWECDKPYTLTEKCIEIYHWRHGAYQDESGNWKMDESVVAECVQDTMQNSEKLQQILEQMLRLRTPQGSDVEGGCIDASREYPRWVCPSTADIALPILQPLSEHGINFEMLAAA